MARIDQTSNAKFLDARFAGRKPRRGLYQLGGALSGTALGFTLGGIPGAIGGYGLGSYVGGQAEKGESINPIEAGSHLVYPVASYLAGYGLGNNAGKRPSLEDAKPLPGVMSPVFPKSVNDIVSMKPLYETGLNFLP